MPTIRFWRNVALVALFVTIVSLFDRWNSLSRRQRMRRFGWNDAVMSSERFRSTTSGPATTDKLALRLRLKRGVTYLLNETTSHVASTWSLPSGKEESLLETPKLISQVHYDSTVALEMTVLPRSTGGSSSLPWEARRASFRETRCRVRVLDFLAYYEKSARIDSGTNEMFRSVQDATRGIEFDVVLDEDGTIKSSETFELRKAILRGLHKAGQMPLHLEHAVLINGEAFPANGASFGPVGRTRVAAVPVRVKGFGCTESDYANTKGRIAVVDRGSCEFEIKATSAFKAGAEALVVVDRKSKSDEVKTYMVGEADVPIVCVIVSGPAGDAIESLLSGNSNNGKFEILGGVDALLALQKSGRSPSSSNDMDGIDDVVGVGYVIEEILRSRLSVFPSHAVGFNDEWARSEMILNPADPSAPRAVLDESYMLSSATQMTAPVNGVGHSGDLLAEIKVETHERGGVPAPKFAKKNDKQEDDNDDDDPGPMFQRPSLRGHELQSQGTVKIHVPTGWILQGRIKSQARAKKKISVQEKNKKEPRQVDAHVVIEATTVLWGGRLP